MSTLTFYAQDQADSLLNLLKSANKTDKIQILHQLTRQYMVVDGDLCMKYANEAISLADELNKPEEKATAVKNLGNLLFYMGEYRKAETYYLNSIEINEKTGNLKGIAGGYNNIGVINSRLGNYEKALNFYQRSMQIKKELGDLQGVANTLNNIGEIYKFRGDYPNAILNYQQSYDMKKDLNDKMGMANSLNNLGEIYVIWADYEKALQFYLEASTIWIELNNDQFMATSFHNIGEIYQRFENYAQAEKYYFKALDIQKAREDRNGMAFSLRNLGKIKMLTDNLSEAENYFLDALSIEEALEDKSAIAITLNYLGELNIKKKQSNTSLDYFKQALEINQELENVHGMAVNLLSLGKVYYQLEDYSQSITYHQKSLEICETHNFPTIVQGNYLSLASNYQKTGDFKQAYQNYHYSQEIKDSLNKIERHNRFAELETKYQSEKKEKELQLKDVELGKKEAEIKQRNFQRNALIIGFALVFFLALAIYRSFKQKQKANLILSHQKEEIEDKNKEITASIRYAKNIQNALLPHLDYIKEIYPDSFIYYRPKDIVSGDFYWFGKDSRYSYVAAVDATGHGVPGAFISLLGYNLLNTILKENPGIKPHEILNELNIAFSERMYKGYEQEALRDSMDLALCRIDEKNMLLEYSGAYNPLWIIRKGELAEFKANKLSIGSFREFPDRKYTDNEIRIEKDDMIYLFTDGFADQFGGPMDKKFMYKRQKELLLSIHKENTNKQVEVLDNAFIEWKGGNEQIDDILVIGIHII